MKTLRQLKTTSWRMEDPTVGVARSILSTRNLCRATVSVHLGRRELLLGFTRIAELGPESTNRLASFRGKVHALADMIELGSDSGGYLEWVYADLGFKTNYHRLNVRLESSRHPCCSWSFGLKTCAWNRRHCVIPGKSTYTSYDLIPELSIVESKRELSTPLVDRVRFSHMSPKTIWRTRNIYQHALWVNDQLWVNQSPMRRGACTGNSRTATF